MTVDLRSRNFNLDTLRLQTARRYPSAARPITRSQPEAGALHKRRSRPPGWARGRAQYGSAIMVRGRQREGCAQSLEVASMPRCSQLLEDTLAAKHRPI